MQIINIAATYCVLSILLACSHDVLNHQPNMIGENDIKISATSLTCTTPPEQINYSVFKMHSDGSRVGDLMPFYDNNSKKFILYYLKDIWNNAERHPIHAFTTSTFYNYTETKQIIGCSNDPCAQDFAIGTGSVYKYNNRYYAFYTGHNPNAPSACSPRKEGIMLATSSQPTSGFKKSTTFQTLYAPAGQGFDEQDNFRDPYVFYDNGMHYMLLSARKNVNGTWRGVVIRYKSTNLTQWVYDGIVYDGGAINYFMLECAEIFKLGSTFYLLYSDTNTRSVYYRKSTSPHGPWTLPVGPDRFDGIGIYAARTAADAVDRYIFGWTPINANHDDFGQPIWGGNLVAHKLYQLQNGDLAVTIPHTQQNFLNTNTLTITKSSQWGNVVNTHPGTHSYRINSPASLDVANVIFNPVPKDRYKIKCEVSYTQAAKDFGFMMGACDGYENFFSLRFVPSQQQFRLDKVKRSQITPSTPPTADVPFTFPSNTTIPVEIVVENSMVVVYVDNKVALSTRIYKAKGTHWGIFVDNGEATFTNIQVSY